MSRTLQSNQSSEILEDILDVIDDAPLLADETQADFDLIEHAVHAEIRPRDLRDKLLAYELTQTLWELRRYRRTRNHLITQNNKEHLTRHLTDLLIKDDEIRTVVKEMGYAYGEYVKYLVDVWRHEDEEDASLVDYYLKKHCVSLSEIVAQGLSARLNTVLPLEATIAELIKRCDHIFAQLDRRAESRARLIGEGTPSLAVTPHNPGDDDELA